MEHALPIRKGSWKQIPLKCWKTVKINIKWMLIVYFPGSSSDTEPAYNAGDPGSIPGSATSPEEGIGYPFQYSGFPGESEGEEATCNAGDLALLSGLGRCLEEGWHPTPVFLPGESPWTEEPGRLHGSTYAVAKSQTQLSNIHFHFTFYIFYLLSKEWKN